MTLKSVKHVIDAVCLSCVVLWERGGQCKGEGVSICRGQVGVCLLERE